ncbi:glutathione S-transferase [Advenella mimigardefordensis]|uniref:Putative glutathione S-transferase n=1 Tax=Advenella mimigardefordensis (strain DSM 17166 / LMG 22922 / DPN7) TaxID=1247726 RepID=W0PE92_ADVMD|nr:glutathione S-transferase [Advenella mimigardefordensis]AHG63792.1 putative glutathione S-transferase [Advenella mimigardefordensis DPN7]
MKIFYSALSPFVRKTMIVAEELGIADRIERLPAAANPVNRDRNIIPFNPLGQVPTLITDDEQVLFDSKVICEYLNTTFKGKLFGDDTTRFRLLTDHAAADGVIAASLLVRYELLARPEALRWNEWVDGQTDKITTGLQYFEDKAQALYDRIDIVTITLACAFDYLDLRLPDYQWQKRFPGLKAWYDKFSVRESIARTKPQ